MLSAGMSGWIDGPSRRGFRTRSLSFEEGIYVVLVVVGGDGVVVVVDAVIAASQSFSLSSDGYERESEEDVPAKYIYCVHEDCEER